MFRQEVRQDETGGKPDIERLVKFCIENWDNGFMQEIKKEITERAELLARI